MKKNQMTTLECTGLTDLGYGICRENDHPIYVSNLLPGERAEIKIIKSSRNYSIGKVIGRLNDAPGRIEPKCPAFKRCGGCSYQNLSYASQMELKQKQLDHLFEGIPVMPIIGMDDPFYYRSKAQFPIQVEDGKVTGGFYQSRTNKIVPIEECMIQNPMINKIWKWILENITVQQASPLRHVFIRSSLTTHQSQVVFIGKKDHNLKVLADKLHEQFESIVSVVFSYNDCQDNVILKDKYTILYGTDYITEDCLGLKIQLHFKSFFQVNPVMMEKLYEQALDLADLNKEDTVIELYSGTGTIGMLAAREAKEVVGVEIVPEAVENARENAKINHIGNIRFVCQDASQFAHEQKGTADVVMVDPPRKGMSEQGIADVCMLSPRRVVYISCNPRTLARDLKLFEKDGYVCRKIQPVDMFAQTAGVECAALLERKEA